MDGLPPACRGRGHRLPRAWITLSPLSDHGKFSRNRGKGKTNTEISLEISSQLTAIAASGISQLRDYINVSNCPWWVYLSPRHPIAVLTPIDRCNILWWWVPPFKDEPCEELPRSVNLDNWVWCHLVLVPWEAVNTHSLLVFSPALLALQIWIVSSQSAIWFKCSLDGNCPVTLAHSKSILPFLNWIITKANRSQMTHIQKCKDTFKVILNFFHSPFLPPNSLK